MEEEVIRSQLEPIYATRLGIFQQANDIPTEKNSKMENLLQLGRSHCWYFLTITDKIRKRIEDTVVALHPESIQGILFSQGTEV